MKKSKNKQRKEVFGWVGSKIENLPPIRGQQVPVTRTLYDGCGGVWRWFQVQPRLPGLGRDGRARGAEQGEMQVPGTWER